MENNQKISIGKYVEIAYEIFVVTDRGDASVFKFTDKEPDRFVFGMDEGMIQGFINGLNGKAQGDEFEFTLEPKEAFGDYDDEMVIELPREAFEVDGEFDTEHVKPGAHVPMRTQEGYIMEGIVLEIGDKLVKLDFNHELAGETVKYVGKVLLVRDATPEELAPKHHQCGCGCDHDHGHDHCDHHHEHGDHCGCGHCHE